MKIKCEYCGARIEDTADKCPNCGAANTNVKRTVNTTPKTIEELKSWYRARNLPPYETTRFFIGIDYRQPRAFGIYKDGNEFVVYKNKDDGSRAVRYRGTDEAYAVNELYLKLKSEILNQKARSSGSRSSSGGSSRKRGPSGKTGLWWFCGLFGLCWVHLYGVGIVYTFCILIGLTLLYRLGSHIILDRHRENEWQFKQNNPKLASWLLESIADFFNFKKPTVLLLILTLVVSLLAGAAYNRPHYYIAPDHGDVYVSYHGDWYEYDTISNDYTSINHDYLPVEIQNHPADYEYNWNGGNWNSGITEFKDSRAFEDNYKTDWGSSSDWSSDSDYDWDSGSDWDSGGTDWGSDW